MPVRSLNSPVFKWPDREAVDLAAREWAARLDRERTDVVAIGYFGSYARGDWGVGSDVDVIVILTASPYPFERRAASLDASLAVTGSVAAAFPVPADLLVYTWDEWQLVTQWPAGRRLGREVVWVYGQA